MTAHVYDFVLLCLLTCLCKVMDVVFESLPLGLCAVGIVFVVRRVCAVEQPKIRSSL